MNDRLIPRHDGNEGAQAPNVAANAGAKIIANKYSRWRVNAPDGAVGPNGSQSEYISGTFDDVRRVVTRDWPARTRMVWAPAASRVKPGDALHVPEGADIGSVLSLNNATPITAVSIATEAARLVGGDRAATHGDKSINFKNTADLWNAILRAKLRQEEWDDRVINAAASLTALDVGNMLEAFKLARRYAGSFNLDDYVDAAGYAACAGEIAAKYANKST